MITAEIQIDLQTINKLVEENVDNALDPVRDRVLQALKESTPVDTGKAAGSWVVQKTSDGFEAINRQEYIGVLNAGYSSQAPRNFIERVALSFGRPQGVVVEYR